VWAGPRPAGTEYAAAHTGRHGVLARYLATPASDADTTHAASSQRRAANRKEIGGPTELPGEPDRPAVCRRSARRSDILTDLLTEPIFGDEDDRLERELDLERHNRESVYNVRGYAPVHEELRHAPIEIGGRLPADLEGVYLRNGANVQFARTHARLHPFNGAGMLHQIQIRAGTATYSNTYVRTPRFVFEERAGREVYLTFSDIAGGGRAGFGRLQLAESKKQRGLIPNFSALENNTSSTSVQYHCGRIYCLQETGYPFALDARIDDGRLVLDGRGRLETWNGQLTSPFSAHPRIDPATGELYNLSIDRASGDIYYARLSAGALRDHHRICEHGAAGTRMGFLHDCFLTENYLIFPDTSLRIDPPRLLSETGSVFFFDPEYKLRWGVLPREPRVGDTVRWFAAGQPAMMWHAINGWEERAPDGGTRIVLYAPVFASYPPDVPIHSPREPAGKLHRWVLDLTSGTVAQEELLLDHGYERPSLNLGYVGKTNRFAYLLDEERGGGYMGKGVLKYDLLERREAGYLDYGDFYGGEALFVPKRDAVDEDDGYLLDLLMAEETAELIVIDAKSMRETARLRLPSRVPFGVHGCWLDEEKLANLAPAG
jgi:carotenoid cleavage dioxygenase